MERLSVEEIKNLAERVAKEKLAPRASEIDHNHNFPWENICELRKELRIVRERMKELKRAKGK